MSHLTYRRLADRWRACGRQPQRLLDQPFALLALRCWLVSTGADCADRSHAIGEFALASLEAQEAAHPGWYEAMLRERAACDRCGETYRLENHLLCTGCLGSWCPGCAGDVGGIGTAAVHHCGGDLVG